MTASLLVKVFAAASLDYRYKDICMDLAALLAAERELGRLSEWLDRPGMLALSSPDALRREVLASLDLDGVRVLWDDLVIGLADSDRLPLAIRPGAVAALRLLEACDRLGRLRAHLAGPADDEDRASSLEGEGENDEDGLLGTVAAARRDARDAIDDIDAFLASLREDRRPSPSPADGADTLLAPLSRDWLGAAWTAMGGPILDAALLDRIGEKIDAAGRQPGLMGVAAALHGLHAEDLFPEPDAPHYAGLEEDDARRLHAAMTERATPGLGWRFARMIAPWLIQRGCGLDAPGPWLSETILRQRYSYVRAAADSLEGWTAWLCRTLAEGLVHERRRGAALENAVDLWQHRLGGKRRWGRTREALLLLTERPALTTELVERRRGFSRRAAQMLLSELEAAGILREATGRPIARLWIADAMR